MAHDHHMMMMNGSDMATMDPHAGMDHGGMSHGGMDHGGMDHGGMDHSGMDHSGMDHSGMDHGSMDHGSMDHGMKMYFHFSSSAHILFQGWNPNSWEAMFGSCIAVFVLAALYEGLKVVRETLLRRSTVNVRYHTMPLKREEGTVIEQSFKTVGSHMLSCSHVIQTLLHVLQVVLSYFLMLIFMTYNGWLCLAVAFGAGAGYFLFSWKRAVVVDINEHCH